jgi:hypothetical protein
MECTMWTTDWRERSTKRKFENGNNKFEDSNDRRRLTLRVDAGRGGSEKNM